MKYTIAWDLIETDPDTYETTNYISIRDEAGNKVDSTTYTTTVAGQYPRKDIEDAIYERGYDVQNWEEKDGLPVITVTPGEDE